MDIAICFINEKHQDNIGWLNAAKERPQRGYMESCHPFHHYHPMKRLLCSSSLTFDDLFHYEQLRKNTILYCISTSAHLKQIIYSIYNKIILTKFYVQHKVAWTWKQIIYRICIKLSISKCKHGHNKNE